MANVNVLKQFNSINDMVRYLDNARISSTWQYSHQESQSLNNPEWSGYNSYDEAREKILHGDKDLATKLRGTEKLDINIPVTGMRRRITTAVAGFAPHVPNYLAGVPNNMLWVVEKKAKSPVLTIVYNIGCLGFSWGEQVTEVSVRIMSAIMSAERKGYRINLWVASSQTSGSEKCGFICKIKEAGQHIDTLKMALPMISPAMNRRFGFRFRETMQGLGSHWTDGYGHSMNTNELEDWLHENQFRYDVAFAYESVKNISNVEQLEKLFLDAANKLKK